VNGLPAIVTVPLLGGSLLGATENPTLPGPVPAGVDNEIQLTPLLAVHGQPAPVVTDTDPPPPVPGTSWLGGAMLNVHPLACAIETA
jgi:hypothetical protein